MYKDSKGMGEVYLNLSTPAKASFQVISSIVSVKPFHMLDPLASHHTVY
jgi:hypothetical protein